MFALKFHACSVQALVCQLSSLMCNVIIAAHARRARNGPSVGVDRDTPIHSLSQSVVGLLIAPRHLCSHARYQSGRLARWSRYAYARPFIGLARSFMSRISCSVVLRASASLLYFRVSFVFEFLQ